MRVFDTYDEVYVELGRCDCGCGCRHIAGYWNLLWADHTTTAVDDSRDQDGRLICVRCFQDKHTAFERATMAVAGKGPQ